MTSTTADIHLVFNGEIYNFPSIQQQLRKEYGLEPSSEAEALLQLYERHGVAFAEQLTGDFAVVVLDSRSRTCFAYRDPIGVKPLYYATIENDQTWIISSHVKAFFQHPGFSTALDSVSLMERRVLSFWSSHLTCFDAIHQLIPGHYLRIQLPHERHSPKFEREIVRFSSWPHEELAGDHEGNAMQIDVECAEVIERAVRRRIEHSDVTPVVFALSGGIDSSLMTILARGLYDRTTAITIFDSDQSQDPDYAAQLSKELGLPNQVYQIGLSEFIQEFPKMVLEIAGPNPTYTPYFLGSAMKHYYPTAKVLLCGEGADEFFVGYPLMLDDGYFLSKTLTNLRGLPTTWILKSSLLQKVLEWQSMCREDAWLSLVSMFQREQLVNLHLVPFDHGTMAHGVECRVPFLDNEVIQFIQKFPARFRVLGNTTKVLLRILLSQKLGPNAEVARTLLTRLPAPAFFSTLGCQHWLKEFLREKLQRSKLAQSELANFTTDNERLFWLASLATIFLKYRGRIDGMQFNDLANEVFTAPVSNLDLGRF